MSEERTYTIRLNEEQLQLLNNACELMSRLHMGQWDSLRYELGLDVSEPSVFDLAHFAGLLPYDGGYWGIYHEKTPENARKFWDMLQVMRHRLAWDREPEGGIYCQFDEPRQSSELPMIEVKRA